ncbi:MAG: exo-alpha-sialidase [Candidatus Latescibacteria bacterium]|nr:exo-alpha-sialidase [Candidatus Latescibacterota bacterium]
MTTRLRIGNGTGWTFLNGQWTDGDRGELIPPDGGGKEYIAVAHGQEYADLTATFRFKFRSGFAGVRLLFRLQDMMRYYALDIPWGGQQNRNRHFWAGIVVADGSPLQRYLQLGLVLGVCPEHERWYEAHVECRGSRIRTWIEGRPVADIQDTTYTTGRVGLMAAVTAVRESPHFVDLEVEGTPFGPSSWRGLDPPPQHWITPCCEVDPDAYQSYPNVIKSRSGSLTVQIPFGNPNQGEVRRTVTVQSTDGGRTFSAPQPATLPQGFGAPFVRQDGTWVCVHGREKVPIDQALYTVESHDEGHTWSDAKPLHVIGEWPKEFSLPAYPSGRPLRLRDGTLLVTAYCTVDGVATNFVFRSTDDGMTWAAPVRCDRNNTRHAQWFCPANFSELGLAEVTDNVILGYGRPGPWPYMWQVQSHDGGQTWQPAAFGSFPGYCITLTRTTSGALVAIHRFPYLTANVSYDGGRTWAAGTIIDYPAWANHHALEVEPDVVLVVYMGHIVEKGQPDTRVLRLRVTGHGLEVDRS